MAKLSLSPEPYIMVPISVWKEFVDALDRGDLRFHGRDLNRYNYVRGRLSVVMKTVDGKVLQKVLNQHEEWRLEKLAAQTEKEN